MFRSLVSRLLNSGADDSATKRTYTRHEADGAICTINNESYYVTNWGFGGVELLTEDGTFIEGREVTLTLTFQLLHSDLDITHTGTVVRSADCKTAISFTKLPPAVSLSLQRVIDDRHARQNPSKIGK
ncbi:MAG TPA: hypothetical protein VL625_10110 [Patescibacteria group bacterium]|nr:hypothetical protein [Patescibacteria group bacterium]